MIGCSIKLLTTGITWECEFRRRIVFTGEEMKGQHILLTVSLSKEGNF